MTTVSNCLVSSRHTVTRRAPARAAHSVGQRRDAVRRLEQHLRAAVVRSAASSARWRAAPLGGAKPQNRKPAAAASPATLSAATTLLAPGIGTTRKPAAATACTSAAPGSDTAGVPASLA